MKDIHKQVRFSDLIPHRFQNKTNQNVSVFSAFVSAQIEMVPQNYQKLESEEHIKLMEKHIWHNREE